MSGAYIAAAAVGLVELWVLWMLWMVVRADNAVRVSGTVIVVHVPGTRARSGPVVQSRPSCRPMPAASVWRFRVELRGQLVVPPWMSRPDPRLPGNLAASVARTVRASSVTPGHVVFIVHCTAAAAAVSGVLGPDARVVRGLPGVSFV